jgi:hypothetical protein
VDGYGTASRGRGRFGGVFCDGAAAEEGGDGLGGGGLFCFGVEIEDGFEVEVGVVLIGFAMGLCD